MPLLTPMGSVSTVDEKGYHRRSRQPFPGAAMFAELAAVYGQAPLLIAGLVPSCNRGRRRSAQAMANMRQLGMGCIMYANDHKGMLPPDLGTLAVCRK